MYTEEISDLEKQGNVKDTSGIVRLQPMLIDGVMRIGSHISEAPIMQGDKYPMIILPKHHVARLLIEDAHQKLAHAGQERILTNETAVLDTKTKISCAKRHAVQPYMQETEGNQNGADDGCLTNISHHSLPAMLHSHWSWLLRPIKHQERESSSQELGCNIYLFEL